MRGNTSDQVEILSTLTPDQLVPPRVGDHRRPRNVASIELRDGLGR
jgi:hypothetical protein